MFIVKESLLNGTVTMNVEVSILDFKVWQEAVNYFIQKYGLGIEVLENNNERVSYRVKRNTGFQVYGLIENKEAKVL